MECIACTVGYPCRRRKAEGKDYPCTLKGIQHLQREDRRPDMSKPEAFHVRPDGKSTDKPDIGDIRGEPPTLHCRICPKRCGVQALHTSGLTLCRKHLKECGYPIPATIFSKTADIAKNLLLRLRGTVTILALFSLLIGCAQLRFNAEVERWIYTPTGAYRLIKANDKTVQHVWETRAKEDRKDLEVDAFTDVKRMQIWYSTEQGLKEELHNVQSIQNLMEAAKDDLRTVIKGRRGWWGQN